MHFLVISVTMLFSWHYQSEQMKRYISQRAEIYQRIYHWITWQIQKCHTIRTKLLKFTHFPLPYIVSPESQGEPCCLRDLSYNQSVATFTNVCGVFGGERLGNNTQRTSCKETGTLLWQSCLLFHFIIHMINKWLDFWRSKDSKKERFREMKIDRIKELTRLKKNFPINLEFRFFWESITNSGMLYSKTPAK